MNEKTWVILAGTLVMIVGYATHLYARHHFRTVAAPGLWPQVRRGRWRVRREWFSTEHGYRMSRRGGWMMSLGGLVALIGSLL